MMNVRQEIGEAFQIWWRVLSNPYVETFRQEAENVSLARALVWMAASSFLVTLLALLLIVPLFLIMFVPLLASSPGDLPPELAGVGAFFVVYIVLMVVMSLVMSVVMGPVTLLMTSGVYYVLAMLFGGRGQFEKQTYLLATYLAPLELARLVTMVPVLGIVIYVGIALYKLVLAKQAIEVTHELESGKSIVVVAIPVLAWMLMIGCFVAMYFAMFASFFSMVASQGQF